jgi:integrase
MARTLHKLTEAAIRAARPIERIVPTSGIRGNDPEKTAADFYRKHGVWPPHVPREPPFDLGGDVLQAMVNAKDRRAEVLAQRKFSKALRTMHDPSLVMRDGKPVMIRRRSRLLADGGNLFLQVSAGDDDVVRKSWIFKYASSEQIISKNGRVRRREVSMGLGPLHTVDLQTARAMALELRKQRLAGIDPLQQRREAKTAEAVAKAKAMTFDDARDAFIADHKFKWHSVRHAQTWQQSLADHVSPAFGHLPVAVIDQEMVIKMLRPLFQEMPVTAGRVRGRVEAILDWATQNRHRPVDAPNPARWKGALVHVFGARRHEVEHLPALAYGLMPAYFKRLQEMTDDPAALALRFLILTAVRTGAVLASTWSWLPKTFADDDHATWNVPKEYTKHRRAPHRVPLVPAMVDVLDKLPRGEPSERVFPIHEKAMRLLAKWALADIGAEGDVTPHGMRSCLKDWASETQSFEPMVVEQALGHWQGDESELAYRRGDLLLKRKILMRTWSDYCDGRPAGAENVVAMTGRRA